MTFKESMNEIKRHLMTGVSYMIPIVVAGGLLVSIAVIIGGTNVWQAKGTFAANLRQLGQYGLQLIVPVIAAYIAYSIADKPGLAPGLIVGMLAYTMGTGFLGGIIVGLLVGYLVNLLKKIKVPQVFSPVIAIIVIPVLSTFIVGMLMIYIMGGPIAVATKDLTNWLTQMKSGNAILMSVILGAMMAFDLGGPINKVAYTFALAAIDAKAYVASSAVFIAISIPPLIMAFATFLSPKKYTMAEKEAARSAILMGIIGITEGAIPFAVADPFRVIPSVMIGTAITSALGTAFGVVNTTVMSSIFAIPFVNKPLFQIVAVVVGVIVGAIIVNFFKPVIKGEALESE